MFEGIGLASVLGFITTVGVGVLTPDEIRTYVSLNQSIHDEMIDYPEPLGYYGIEADVYKHVRFFVEHQSSPKVSNDHPGLNHAGVKFLLPVNNNTKFYSGLSLTAYSQPDIEGPLVSIGVESGTDDIKIFSEYLADTYDMSGGRFTIGAKLFFN